MNVAAIIVTRGDQDLTPILDALPSEWERIVWNNGMKSVWIDAGGDNHRWENGADLAVYGRYAAIARTDAELIYVQDDDCVVSDPRAIVEEWKNHWRQGIQGKAGVLQFHVESSGHVVCNMPQEFRHDFYEEHALVGFGACFHRDAPVRAFERLPYLFIGDEIGWFHRTCDIIFTGLTPRVLVDVPKTDLPWAHYETRMWKQPGHMAERVRMLDLVRTIA